jgi:NAD(P)H dehydrogenase (quinone)
MITYKDIIVIKEIPMIIVTGATGQLGRAVLEKLVARVPAHTIGATARDPRKASALSDLGIRVRAGDFAKPETLPSAFEGASQVLVISSNAAAYGGDTLAQHRAAIDAARAAGAKRILYTSHMAASPSSAFPPAIAHAQTEEMLRASGVAWTSLRDGFHAASAFAMMGDAFETGVVSTPADGKVCWTTHADLAEAAAAILANEGCFDGPTPPLTGSETLDFADLARLATDAGHPMRREVISEDELVAKLAARGAGPFAKLVLGYYAASRNGEFARTDEALETLIGRPAVSMREVIAQKTR